jgi:hypothetical protein
MVNKDTKGNNLGDNLKELAKIAEWFDEQENKEEPDFEEGLNKIREAAKIIKVSRERLSNIENEFEEIKSDIADEESDEGE